MVEQIASGAAAVGFAAYAVRGKSSRLIAPSVWHGDRTRAALALTFDDGPSESTPALLDLLAHHNAKATFFMCGQNVRRLPQIARAVAAAGHEIGNHTDSHPLLALKSPGFIEQEVARAQATLREIGEPNLFRAPYGVRWPGLRAAQARHRLTGVMWTTIGRDWMWPADKVSQLLLKEASNGAIFCLHDGRTIETRPDIQSTLKAVETILPVLKDRYAFQTVSELCGL